MRPVSWRGPGPAIQISFSLFEAGSLRPLPIPFDPIQIDPDTILTKGPRETAFQPLESLAARFSPTFEQACG
ncbi:MAG: hypothetical protein DRQ60_11105 [Gammaproteobacteria bacterium]|nr:MAG: hypothetical protein DRQ60_11105 [Gammaproteobacteria bacterium]